ncbi:hypothetical protein HC251_22590 [Iamia sp. SCSIO 61187]|uniref:hypothetical protein n=1 Tax=Iamia sp. SCSIO 61187 TaxID=2722752 RepID=UPI001C62554E|nr:hypothetical protein [Iamia sp. SCSIO 61187]QYG94941.1 hypothetical protein HC251_22590 [Iamia sp. SCSIO 61187]
MTYPPAPGPTGGDDATRAFPASGPAGPVPPGPPPPSTPGAPAWGADPSAAGGGPPTGPVPQGYPAVGPAPAPGWSGEAPSGPPSSAPPPGPSPGRPRGRIVGRALLVLVVIGALAGTTAWGFVNRSSAERWRDRSEAADADLREALDRVDATSSELEDARTRLRDLANENAGETDRNRILSDIVAQAPEVTAALADCQQQTTDLANDIIAAFGDPAPDAAGLQERTDEVNEVCEDALDQAQELEAAIEALGI